MLRSLKLLRQYLILAVDGSIGRVHDFYFEDDTWTVRYMIAKTGPWLTGRKVLISTGALGQADWSAHTFGVTLTREQVRRCPPIDADKPVSRQQEVELHAHFGWPHYWLESPFALAPPLVETLPDPGETKTAAKGKSDPHLRSVRAVTGYRVHASDGDLGRVRDFIADDEVWLIRYLVIEFGAWMPGKRVLISPQWLSSIDCDRRRVNVSMDQKCILSSPEFHPEEAVNRAYEEKLYDYYGRPIYWAERVSRK